MKHSALSTLLILLIHECIAQVSIGYYHDTDLFPTHGQIDLFEYSPSNQLEPGVL